MEAPIPFFILDDDDSVISSIKKLIEKLFPSAPIFVALDGSEGWELIKRQNRQCVVISNFFLPKLNGLQILLNLRASDSLKESYFIMMSSMPELEDNLKALKHGADDLITKPISFDDFLAKLRTAARIINMQTELKEERSKTREIRVSLEEDIERMHNLVANFIHTRLPYSIKISEKIANYSVWIAKQLGNIAPADMVDIENAAKLCFAGKLILHDKFLEEPVTKSGILYNTMMAKVPEYANELLTLVRGYENSAKILSHVFENYDGTGFPDRLKGWQIPIGSRIIRAAFDLEELYLQHNRSYSKALDLLYHETKRLYDYWIVAFLDQYFAMNSSGTKYKEVPVKIRELTSDMTLSRNLILESGIILMGAGTEIREEQIDKILLITKTDPIIGNIFVYKY